MIRQISTVEQLADLIRTDSGYLYNDFGGRNPKMCPIHHLGCRWVLTMIRPGMSGKLTVPKLWGSKLEDLIAEISRQGKVYAFCGSEPELAASHTTHAVGSTGAHEHAAGSARPASPASTGEAGASTPDFSVRLSCGVVTVQSNYRLQFDEKPRTKALKAAIGRAVENLRAEHGQILEAVYTSSAREFVDVENVLLYNVGTGRFAAAAREGLRFERVFARPSGDARAPHQHRYSLTDAGSSFAHWRRGPEIVAKSGLRIPRMDASSKPDDLWLATRRAVAPAAIAHSGHYGLTLDLHVAAQETVRPADIVKPLIDGVVAGLHAHDGRDGHTVIPRLAERLRLTHEEIERLLSDESRAWLGTRRLLWPRSQSVQWNPGDDDCVCASLHVHRGDIPGWHLDFALYAVQAAF